MREVRQSLSKTVRGNLLDQNIFVIGIRSEFNGSELFLHSSLRPHL